MKKFVLYLCLLISACIFFTQSANAKNIKFAQVTDVLYRGSSAQLDKIISDINKTSDIDFVVFTGNNIGKPKENNLKNFMNDVKHLNKPYYIVLGNKDNDVIFIVADGSKELIPSVNGFYNHDTIAWVDKQLTKYAKNKVVILQHFPLANKPNNEFYYTYNILEYMQMLSRHNNVIAVVTGHYNKNDEVMYNGVYHITTPNASQGYYKIIDIEADNNYGVYTLLKEIK